MMHPAIIVTGASSGIGRELARLASRDGTFVLLVARSRASLDELAAELASKGLEAGVLNVDLSERDAGACVERALLERGLYCDVLVNCAGIGVYGPAVDLGRAEQLALFDLDVRALTDLSLRFLPAMIDRGRGGILNVSSIAGYAPGPYMAVYFAAKAYVRSFSAALADDVAGTGVTVTCFAAGFVRTPFLLRNDMTQTRLFKIAPRANAPEIAATGWRGFKAGKRVVISGWGNRLIAAACAVLPDSLLAKLVARLQRPRPSARL